MNGTEFLLVFPDGDFSEDSTFLVSQQSLRPSDHLHMRPQLTDWMAHVPKDVLAKNFQTDMSAFDHIPGKELYIFPAGASEPALGPVCFVLILRRPCSPEAPSSDAKAVQNPQGQVPSPFSYEFSKVKPTPLEGGSVKIADTSVFPISETISVAEVTVVPGAMRELHVSRKTPARS